MNNSFLGKGWGFPPQFSKSNCTARMVSEEEDICESLKILLDTRMGERVMRPNYGCNLDVLLFEPISTSFLTYVQSFIENSILLHEPRIDLTAVEINADRQFDGVLDITIEYVIRATNSRFNFVYPFYLKEAEPNTPPIA